MSLREHLPLTIPTRIGLLETADGLTTLPSFHVSPGTNPGYACSVRNEEPYLTTQRTTLDRIRETREAIASAQSAMSKADSGLSGIESFAEKAESARRHPMATIAILTVLGLAATLTFLGLRGEGRD